jgi:formate hydrogenlyase subunit 4
MVVLLMIPALFLFAPQPIRKDKRTVAALVMLAAVVIGVPVYAVICNVCEICKADYWWLIPDCWFLR